jgi:hypothetical protein
VRITFKKSDLCEEGYIFLYGKGYVINKSILNIKNTIVFLKRLIALVIS